MLKQAIAIIILSILIVSFMPYAQTGQQFLLDAHTWISDTLANVFAGGQAGSLIKQLLALLAVPILVGLVPVAIYWLAKRHWFPYFMELVWVCWLVQTSALVILYKAAA